MDDSIKMLPVPNELAHPFFFSHKEIAVKNPTISFSLSENFIYEFFFYNGIQTIKPWINPDETIPILFKEWQKVKDQLNVLYHEREQKNIVQNMKKGIGLFIQLLFWSNGKPVQLKEPSAFSEMDFKPINVQERLEFIISRPKLFHSFIQLSELMTEQEKHYMKKSIQKKASRPKV
jgi:hypothetical protein